MTPRLRNALVVALLAALGVLAGPAAPASAHAVLVSTSPAQNSVVEQAPTQVVLTFTESVTPVSGRVRVIAPDGARVDRDDPLASGEQLIIQLKDGVATRGTYVVTYRVLSADSHPVAGAFTFSVGAPSTPPSVDTEGSNRVAQSLFPPVRWVGYVGLLLLVGATLFLTMLWPRRLPTNGAARVAWGGAGLVALATVAELVIQVPYVTGGFTGDDIKDTLSSQYGAAHLVRLGVLAAALVLLRQVVQGRAGAADRVLLLVLGAIGVATWSVSGHPSATEVPLVTIVADMIHIAAMSVWLGGLVMLVVFLLPRGNATELGAIVPVWSRWATYAVGAVLLTGVAQAIIAVGTFDALVETTYGVILLAKVGLVGIILAVAFLTRRLVAPIETGADPTAAPRLRKVVALEAAVAVLVLALTSVLVQITPARTAAGEAAAPGVLSISRDDQLFRLNADLLPGRTGLNQLHLYAYTPDGKPADIKEWTVRASTPGIEQIDATLLVLSSYHAIGQITLPTAGTWTFTFTLRTTEIDQGTVTATFAIAPR